MKLAKCLFHFITNANRNTGKRYTHQHTMILVLEIQRVKQASRGVLLKVFKICCIVKLKN